MYCSKCGKKIEEGINFCSHCGNETKVVPTDHKINIKEPDNKNYKKNKNIYVTIFLILIIPATISKIFFYAGYPILTESLANTLSIITTVGVVILTIWYSTKINLKIWQAILLGLLTLLPLMVWLSFIILLNIKSSKSSKFFSFSKTLNKQGAIILFIILLFIFASTILYNRNDDKNKKVNISNIIPHITQDDSSKIDIYNNPEYLFDKNFKPDKILYNGIGIGDPKEKININLVSDTNNYGWISMNYGGGYRIAQNKVVEINIGGDFIKNIGITREELIKVKFGQPDEFKVVGNLSDVNTYYYYDRGIIVRWIKNTDSMVINIVGVNN